VTEDFFRDPVKWKGVLGKLFSSHVDRRRGDENVFFKVRNEGSVAI
jgi:hypothetical protein